jgi:hypothetical protein
MAIQSARQAGLERGPYSTLCMVQFVMNDLETAAENARFAVERGEFSGNMDTWGLFYQAQIYLVQGEAVRAAAAIEKMDRAAQNPSFDQAWQADHIACHAMYAIQ